MKKYAAEVIIAGDGVIGLSLAMALSLRGISVVIVAPLVPYNNASWAASGLLLKRGGQKAPSPFKEFCFKSIDLFPEWLLKLEAISGIRVPHHTVGDLVLMNAPEQIKKLNAQLSREDAEYEVRTIQKEGEISSEVNCEKAYFFKDESCVETPALLQSLRQGLAANKVPIINFDDTVTPEYNEQWIWHDYENSVSAEQLVICAGFESGSLMEKLGYSAPLIPVKGQSIWADIKGLERHLYHFDEKYHLAPRENAWVLGSTTEANITERSVYKAAGSELADKIKDFLPGIEISIKDQWCGIRTRTRDRLPWMGLLNGDTKLWISGGHYKNGITMAPLAAECMADLICGKLPNFDLKSFDPLRPKGIKKF